MKKEKKTKQEKMLIMFDWLRYIALVCIVLPVCILIFQGFSYGILGVFCFGVVLFVVNMIIGLRFNENVENAEKKKEQKAKQKLEKEEEIISKNAQKKKK